MVKLPKNSIPPKTRAEWREWLTNHHTQAEGIWLVSSKKASRKPRIEYDEAVEEALCFGWVDSKPNRLDEERSMLWFAPRKAGTGWSKLNKGRVRKTARRWVNDIGRSCQSRNCKTSTRNGYVSR